MHLKTEDGSVLRTARADEGGNWSFSSLPAGTYTVTMEAPAFLAMQIRSILVAGGEERVLPALPLQVATCPPAISLAYFRATPDINSPAIISGAVERAGSNRPMAGVRLNLLCNSGAVCASAVSDSVGRFNIANVRPDQYTLSVERTSFYTERMIVDAIAGVESVVGTVTLDPCRGFHCDPRKKPVRVFCE